MHSAAWTRNTLLPEATDKIYSALRPSFEYLAALQARMEERRFFGSDRLYLEVKAARDTMQLLCFADVRRVLLSPIPANSFLALRHCLSALQSSPMNDLHAIACHNFYPRTDAEKPADQK
jgi:hypothetical protein